MKKCKHCGGENPADALFCSECGRPLEEDEQGAAEASAPEVAKEEGGPAPSTGVEEEEELGPEALGVSLVLQNGNAIEREIEPGGEVVLGRNDFLNFLPNEAVKYISKQHLKLIKASSPSGAVRVEDTDSTNGTKLNGETLKPGLTKEISDGDELDLADGAAVADISLEEGQDKVQPEAEDSPAAGEPEPVGGQEESQPRCSNCGWYNPPGADRCEECGEPL